VGALINVAGLITPPFMKGDASMKRILLLATVAALMALMLVAMAPAALAIGPPGGTGCDAGTTTANHAAQQSSPSSEVTIGDPSVAEHPTETGDEHRNSEPAGEDIAADNLRGDNCRIPEPPGQQ